MNGPCGLGKYTASISTATIVWSVGSNASITAYLHKCDRNVKESSVSESHVEMKRSMCQTKVISEKIWDILEWSLA